MAFRRFVAVLLGLGIMAVAKADDLEDAKNLLAKARETHSKEMDKIRIDVESQIDSKVAAEENRENPDLRKLQVFEDERAELKEGVFPRWIGAKNKTQIKESNSKLQKSLMSMKKAYLKAKDRKMAEVIDKEIQGALTPQQVNVIPQNDQWIKLFSGRTTAGWEQTAGSTTSWIVRNGLITGTGTGNPPAGALVYNRKQFGDFRLRARVKPGTDCGIMFRGRISPKGQFEGYYISLDPVFEGHPFGSLFTFVPGKPYLLRVEAKRMITGEEDLLLEISAVGDEITVTIDGAEMLKFRDTPQAYSSGGIALRCAATSSLSMGDLEVLEIKPK